MPAFHPRKLYDPSILLNVYIPSFSYFAEAIQNALGLLIPKTPPCSYYKWHISAYLEYHIGKICTYVKYSGLKWKGMGKALSIWGLISLWSLLPQISTHLILKKPIIFTYFEHKVQVLEVPEYGQQASEDLGTGLEQELSSKCLIWLSAACLSDLK